MKQITDSFGEFEAAASDYFRELVTGFSVTASLVADSSGNTVSALGSSAGLGNETDLSLLIALRRQAQVIVTSGKTLRADNYRFPKFADLAVLTNFPVDLKPPPGQTLIADNSSYLGLLNNLTRTGYQRIHVEYGLTGIKELLRSNALGALFLSSKQKSGVEILASELGISPVCLELEDLCVGLVAWQTKTHAA